jgi:hypothetical protein
MWGLREGTKEEREGGEKAAKKKDARGRPRLAREN